MSSRTSEINHNKNNESSLESSIDAAAEERNTEASRLLANFDAVVLAESVV